MGALLLLMLNFLLSFVFLLPLRDERGPGKRFPLMTWTLIAINIGIHIVFHLLLPPLVGEEMWKQFKWYLMEVPAAIREGVGLGALSMITSAFLHANWSHLLGNMFYLFFFGRKVEDLIGSWKFASFYLVCIFVSSLVSVMSELALPLTQGWIPSLGASGAIMGLLGAYMFLYSDQRIRTLVIVFLLPIPIKLPVWAFMLYMLVSDMSGALLEQELQALGLLYSQGVGFMAHLGGLFAGIVCAYLFLPGEVLSYRYRPRL
ncbi:MAG TPA: rhomboid family intramembrane serine protease [Anaerolineae bacterium]|nr:rhomboid family intramembrane serine protease [Anaerolineae bacterium]